MSATRSGMSKTFRPWDIDQIWLLPPSVQDLVPAGHMAHFVRDTVCVGLDLSAILAEYAEERGYPPYHPGMMVALLLYAYSRGVYSSRQIARGCEERLDFQAVTAMNRPDFRTISDFRKRHLAALAGLFQQVLRLCRRAGLVDFGHVALDGTKIKANASKNKAMSYARMVEAESDLAAEIAAWLGRAAAADAEEDCLCGVDRRGDEAPEWIRDKKQRLAKIRAAKAELEEEARAEAAAKAATPQRYRGGRRPKHPPGWPRPEAQRNFTDPDSRIMIGRDGVIQAYNAQAAVDGRRQIILAHRLSKSRRPRRSCPAGRCGQRQHRPQTSRGLRRCRFLLRGQSRRPRRAQNPQLFGDRPRRPPDRRHVKIPRRAAGASNARQAQTRPPPQPIPSAKADCRAGFRPDQTSQRVSPVSAARARQGRS